MSATGVDEPLITLTEALGLIPVPSVVVSATRDAQGSVQDFQIVDSNDKVGDYWGHSRASLRGKSLGHVMSPEGASALRTALVRVAESKGTAEEFLLERPVPDPPVPGFDQMRVHRVGDRLLVTFDSATSQWTSLELYRTLLENAADVVIKVDGHGLIDWFLDSTGVLEYQTAELIGTSVDKLVSLEHVLARARSHDDSASPRLERFDAEMRSRGGQLHACSAVGGRLLDDAGGLVGVIVGLQLSDESVARDKAAHEMEEHFQFLATFARDVVAIESGDAVDWVSPNVTQLLGYDDADIVGRSLAELVHPDDRNSLRAIQHQESEPDTVSLTLRMRTAEGHYRWVNLLVRDLEDSVSGSRVRLSSWRDAQGDVMARQALLSSERRYRLLAENSTDLVLECDVNAVVRWMSPTAVASMGWRVEDVVGRSLVELIDEAERVAVLHQFEQIETLHHSAPIEVRYRDTVGATKWMLQQVHRFRGHEDSHYVYVVTLHDMDDLVELRQVARAAERETRLLKEHSSDLVYTTDLEGKVTWASPSLTALLGWQVADVLGTDVVGLMFEDDRPRVLAWRQLLHFGETVEDLEIRVQHADGFFVWMKVRAEPLRDEDGRVIGVVAAGRDCDAEVAGARALRTISAASRVLMRESDPHELLRQICQVAVDQGGYAFAWFGRKIADVDKTIAVVASSSEHGEYLDGIRITWGPGEGGQGPTGRAIRLGQSITVAEAFTEESFRPWSDRARTHGFHSACAIPVFVDGEVEGTWQVYAREQRAFTPSVLSVLEDLALDTGFALSRLNVTSW